MTEEELSNELPNWREIIDYVENNIELIGLSIKPFKFNGLRCFTVRGLPSDYDTALSDIEALVLVEFIIRFEALSPSNEGLDKKRLKELIISKIGGGRIFSSSISGLKKKGLIEETQSQIRPGWRYFADLDIDAIMNEVRADATLNYLTQSKEQGGGILD